MDFKYRTKELHPKTPVTLSPRKPLIGTRGPKKPSAFSPKRVILGVLGGFAIIVIFTYLIGVPITRSTITFLFGGNGETKLRYQTYAIAFDSQFPAALKDKVKEKLQNVSYDNKKRFQFVDNADQSDYILTPEAGHDFQDQDIVPVYRSFFVPVGHFYWLRDGISTDDLKKGNLYTTAQNQGFADKLVSQTIGQDVKLTASNDLAADLKNNENRFGIIDIGELDINYKLLQFDGKYLLDNAPDGGIPYSLVIKKKKANDLAGSGVISAQLQDVFGPEFNKADILKMNITGTTAIARGTGKKTQASGDGGYPAQKIAGFIKDADLVSTSNEVSFYPGCRPASNIMTFCTDPAAIKTLKDIGVNIVQLTGNHNNDYGFKADTDSINMYKTLGWDYFGGGLDATDAAKILYKDMKGTKLAILGYNWYDTTYKTTQIASATHPGANSYSADKIKNDIKTARSNGADFVIVYFTYQECWAYPDSGYANKGYPPCYKPQTSPDQKRDFRQPIDAGADMVVQPNDPQPMTYEIYKGKPIFYSLGNLFFDQWEWLGTRQGLILTNYYYKGKLLNTKITTTLYDTDLRPYVTTGDQRTTLLTALKNARP